MDKIIRVNMSNLEVKSEGVPKEYELLGGRGLTSTILLKEVRPTCYPLGKYNKLIIAPGLLGGVPVSSAHRLSVGAKSPLTGTIKETNAGGTAAFRMARLGIKAIILEGKGEKDGLYLLKITKEEAELLPAEDLRNVGVYEAGKRIQSKYGEKVAIILIGPAGEWGLATAGVTNTDPEGIPTRYCARGGLGAVMGSKGVKAIVLDDTKAPGVDIKDKEGFKKAAQEYHQVLMETPQTAEVYPKYGTPAMINTTNELGGFPTNNFSTGRFEGAKDIGPEKLRETILERGGEGDPTHACMPGCIVKCSNVYPDKSGKALVSPLEYETLGLLGSNCCLADLDDIAQINRICNDLGIDTLEIGGALAIAMEARLLKFGDGKAAIKLVEEIGKRTILGRVLGEGGVVTGRVLGVYRIPAVKGQIMAAYEPRAIKGLGVTYATSPMGADHTSGNTIRASVDHHKADGQVDASRGAMITATIYDTVGLCLFVGTAVKANLQLIVNLLNSRYGINLTGDDLREIAKNVLKREREFNRLAGFTPAHDRLPEFFYEEMNPASNTVFDIKENELDQVFNF